MTQGSNEPFSQIEWENDLTVDDYFNITHKPDLLPSYLRTLYQHTTEGFSDNANADIEIYSKTEILRGVMQYIEEFGIYISSYLRNNRSIVTDLIKTDVSAFYEACKNEEVNKYILEEGVDESYENQLKTVFGYKDLQAGEVHFPSAGETLTKDELTLLVDASIEAIQYKIQKIAQFYIEFRDLYNAIKHGTRITPRETLGVSLPGFSEPIFFEEPYVLALCKMSSPKSEGKPYLLHYPVKLMVSRSMSILDETSTLFKFIRKFINGNWMKKTIS